MLRLCSAGLAGVLAAGAFAAAAQTPEPGSLPEAQSAPATQTASPQPRGPVRVSGGVVAGLKLSGSDPVYPADAKAQGISGPVVLHAIIGPDGRIEKLTVVSGNGMLSGAALDAVKTWVYTPYLLNGEPTAVDTVITVNFQLASQAPSAGGA